MATPRGSSIFGSSIFGTCVLGGLAVAPHRVVRLLGDRSLLIGDLCNGPVAKQLEAAEAK